MTSSGLLALQAADGATVTLERFPILLGRSVPGGTIPDVDVSHLDPDEAVDNRHCELSRVPTGIDVHDLGGVSGTWVNGRRLAPGGRALLEVNGTIRVAGVMMTLVEAAGSSLPEPAPNRSVADASPPSTWLDSRPVRGVPPPPSAGPSAIEKAAPAEIRPSHLDLSGAPVIAREALERGAEVLRIRPGSPLEALTGEHWEALGQQLSGAAAGEAVATARRVLGLPDEATSGEGHSGDVWLEFMVPPLTDRPYLAVQVAARVAAELDRGVLDAARGAVEEGSGLLVVGPWPEPALAALADRFEAGFASTRVVSFGAADWWVPSGWPVVHPSHESAVEQALTSGELFLDQPPASVIEALLRALPRPGGGTVLALRSHSLVAGLELIARQVDPSQLATVSSWQREEAARHFPHALSRQGRDWRFVDVMVDGHGRWSTPQSAWVRDR
ncbi:MAG TPA: FHA domain-containing protein [Candidatus Saccharimonadales bacterium]|nr:FHA domain-containing protein [Candidatus Saccharimonadales bacterium]